jgi:hypothetical protein
MATTTSTARSRPLPTSAATDLWDELAAAAADESPLWAAALRPQAEQERVAVFSPLAAEPYALGFETIYEGYLVHYGRPRLFAPTSDHQAILLGDYLYAQGLVRIAATGDLEAVAALAELISTCAALRAEGAGGDGEEWVAAARRLGGDATHDEVARALATHAERVD